MPQHKDEITQALQIDYPIIQAPMLGVTTPAMVAAVANLGGLGSLPVGGLSPGKTLELIQKTKELTNKPFAVNLFVHGIPAVNEAQVAQMQDFLYKLAAKYNIPFGPRDVEPLHFYSYKEQIDLLLRERIPVVSFTFGIPGEESIRAMKAHDIILIGTATSVQEALLLQQHGIDMITAQGIEAGGHRGSFLEGEPLPQVGLMSLVPQIIDKVHRPVIAAGGIYDGPTMNAAFALGAKAVQVGTAFIASHESAAMAAYKAALSNAADTGTVLTRAFSGRWARGLRNAFITEVEQSGIPIPAYPVQNSLTARFRALVQEQDNKELTNLWAGQSAAHAQAKSTAGIFMELVRELENTL
jgi:nitronate monooxygenase